MKELICFLVLLTCSALLAAGQSDTSKTGKPQPTRPSSSTGAAAEADKTGCLEKKGGVFRLTGPGPSYNLIGHEKELAGHVGDELRVIGTMFPQQPPPPKGTTPVPTLHVKTVEILHVNNPAGRAPVLGPVAGWKTYSNPKYGIRLHVPETFVHTRPKPNWINWSHNFVAWEGDEVLSSFSLPDKVYPNANFSGGHLVISVSPAIRSEGTCLQFRRYFSKWTSLHTIQGITFSDTINGGVGSGMASVFHYLHAYRNGLCYQFFFTFNMGSFNGSDNPSCSIQWINHKNEFQLIDAVLSAVRFVKLEFQRPVPIKPRPTQPPVFSSFTQTQLPDKSDYVIRITWATKGADYVQFHWPCIENVFISMSGAEDPCAIMYGPHRNYPPEGHVTLGLRNFNKTPVTLKIMVEPFRAGVGYPKQSKTLTFRLPPEP